MRRFKLLGNGIGSKADIYLIWPLKQWLMKKFGIVSPTRALMLGEQKEMWEEWIDETIRPRDRKEVA